jgi:hypothetical protein
VTPPVTAPQRARLCPRDSFPMELDRHLARECIEAGWLPVLLYRCANGHSYREQTEAPHTPIKDQGGKACAVCGLPLTPLKGRWVMGGRKYHAGACAVFASRERSTWCNQHPDEPFVLEHQPWYRGAVTPLAPLPDPLPPLDPLAGACGRAWWEGWARVYGYGVEGPGA